MLVADLGRATGRTPSSTRIADADRPVDLVVNNAGFGTSGDFHELDADRLADEIELNVAALTRLSHAALAAMVPRRRGWLLNVSSVASFQPAPRLAVYAATKAYVTSLSESLHEEVKGGGVRRHRAVPRADHAPSSRRSATPSDYQAELPEFVWLDLAEVVTTALDATVKGRALVVPGALYKGASWASGVTPRWLKRVGSGMVQRR